jgi:tyrosyl-tRNA synthetase
MTTPYAFYQFWLNAADADVIGYLKVFTFRSQEEISELERAVTERPQAREAQRALATDVTTLVHGREATNAVVSASQALFGRGELADLDVATLGAAVAELPRAMVPDGPVEVIDLLVAAGLVAGRAAGRRAVAEGGVSINNARVTDPEATLSGDQLLHGRWAVLRRGKRTLAVAERAPS